MPCLPRVTTPIQLPPHPIKAQATGRIRGCSCCLQGEVTAGCGPPSPPPSPCPESVQYAPFLRPFSPHHQLNSLIPTGDKRIFHCNLLLIQRKTGFRRGEVEVGKRESADPRCLLPDPRRVVVAGEILGQKPRAGQPIFGASHPPPGIKTTWFPGAHLRWPSVSGLVGSTQGREG